MGISPRLFVSYLEKPLYYTLLQSTFRFYYTFLLVLLLVQVLGEGPTKLELRSEIMVCLVGSPVGDPTKLNKSDKSDKFTTNFG
jgi:hypothetical protein